MAGNVGEAVSAAPNQTPVVKSSEKTQAKPSRTKTHQLPFTLIADVTFERKNKIQPRLPPHHRIQKRPLNHPPIASPYAGPDVQKVVYVSRTTPIMAVVKRVRKLLEQAEKRSLQREGVLGDGKRQGRHPKVVGPTTKTTTKQEEVLVKGSGRAIEQAVRVGEWFKRHAEDGDGGWVVKVKPASVKVVDDIVDESPADGANLQSEEDDQLEAVVNDPNDNNEHGTQSKARPPRPKKKRKRPMYTLEDVPEARTRFIDAIEISVSLKN